MWKRRREEYISKLTRPNELKQEQIIMPKKKKRKSGQIKLPWKPSIFEF